MSPSSASSVPSPLPATAPSLAGRGALVTGGTHGIGLAIVERFAASGARVVTVARERPAPGSLPEGVAFIPGDLADHAALPDLLAAAAGAAGPIDVLVNNAGIWRETPTIGLRPGDWHEVIAVNLSGPVLLASLAAEAMAAAGRGRIVNVTSIHGGLAVESALAYAAAKAGLNQATRNMAVDLAARGVLVNAVAPGFISTRLSYTDGVHEREADWFRDVYVAHGKLPLRRHAEPAEVAGIVAWLASDDNTYVTGQVIGVDGGLSIAF
ncbi:MAG: SDR family NAD(P)-dependent oxidoreductase [Chloroflexota bacterium]